MHESTAEVIQDGDSLLLSQRYQLGERRLLGESLDPEVGPMTLRMARRTDRLTA